MSRDTFDTEAAGNELGTGVAGFDAGDGRTVLPTSGEDVAARIAAGEQVTSGRVRVVSTRTGRVGTIDAATLEDSIGSGAFRLPTAEEALQGRRGEVFADRGLEAGVMGAANLLTLGAAGRNDATTQGLRDFNEGAFGIGETIASTALSGGAGVLARGALGLGSLGARVGAGAIEGAVATGTEALAGIEGNAGLNAESIMGSLGGSVLLGGSLGAAFELGAAGLGSIGRGLMRGGNRSAAATREAMGALVERATGREAAPGVADALIARAMDTATVGADDGTRAFMRRASSLTEDGRRVREFIDSGARLVDDAARTMRDDINDLMQASRAIDDELTGALKIDKVRRAIDPAAIANAGEELLTLPATIREAGERLRAEYGRNGGVAMANKLDEFVTNAETRLASALQQGGPDGAAQAFAALDNLKRQFGREVGRATRSRSAIRDAAPQLQDIYESGRRFLEREDLFGGAAALQREVNEAWSTQIAASREFERRFLSRGGQQGDAFMGPLREADPEKLMGWLKSTGTTSAALNDDVFRRFVESSAARARAMADNADLTPAELTQVSVIEEALGRLAQRRNEVGESVGAVNQFREAQSFFADRAGVFGDGNATVVGSVIGGGGGAAMGAIASAVSRPDKMLRMMASVERMTQTFRGRLQSRSKSFVERLASPRAGRRASTGALRGAVVGMSSREVADRFDRLVSTVEQNQDSQGLAERLADRTADLGDAAPETATMLIAAVATAQAYLQRQIPPLAFDVPVPLGAPQTRPSDRVTEDEMRALLRTAETIEDPLRVLEEAGRGMLTREHTETLRAVYPQLHGELVQTVTTEIADRGSPLPYESRLTVSLLLGVPTDPSLSGEAIAASQAGYGAPMMPGAAPPSPEAAAQSEPLLTPGNRRPPELSSMYQTTAQRIAS